MFVRAPFRSDPPSAETMPASGELEVNLGERVEMQCVTKGVPAPIISWRTKVIDIPELFDIPLPMPTILRDPCQTTWWWEAFDGEGEEKKEGGRKKKNEMSVRAIPPGSDNESIKLKWCRG